MERNVYFFSQGRKVVISNIRYRPRFKIKWKVRMIMTMRSGKFVRVI